jgi:hypothetical protein
MTKEDIKKLLSEHKDILTKYKVAPGGFVVNQYRLAIKESFAIHAYEEV